MKTQTKQISADKEAGRVYTPEYIVDNILDLAGYSGEEILGKHVIDNSCGDGAFLCRIVSRYCEEFIAKDSNRETLRKQLESFVHGIEIEETEHKKCLENMDKVAASYGVCNVSWDVLCADALCVEQFDKKMDFVLGNPPYVRIHNLGDNFSAIKKFSFSQNGMSDLFIVFYELGIKMLSAQGVLGYITPSSYFNSIAGAYMRKYFVQNRLLKAIVDLKHYQAFSATTYTAITVLQNNRKGSEVDYYEFNNETLRPCYIETLDPDQFFISGDFYFAKKAALAGLSEIYNNTGRSDIYVKNGFATLCDPVFINEFPFNSPFIIPVIKASKGIKQKIFFPYDMTGSLVAEEELRKDEALFSYLTNNKERLLKRSNERDASAFWYAFGRSQAIGDTFREKLAINSLLRSEEDCKFVLAPAGTGVYGGLYITSDSIPLEEVARSLKTKEFMSYIALLGKYKSGGYYTYSSKDVKRFLDYKFACCEQTTFAV